MPAPPRPTSSATALALCVAAVLGCSPNGTAWPGQPEAPAAKAEPPRVQNPTSVAGACRDWSDLDVEVLPRLPESRYIETFEAAWYTVLVRHHDPTLGCTDWPALRLRYGARVAAAKTAEQAYAAMNEMLAELGQSHLAILPPRPAPPPGWTPLERGPAMVPLRARLIDGAMVVTDPSVYGLGSGIPAGSTLVAIDGHAIETLLAELEATHPRPVERAFQAAERIEQWLSCPYDTARTVVYRPLGGKTNVAATIACLWPEVERMSMGNLENVPIELEARRVPGTTIGVVRFNIWFLPLAPRIERAIAELEQGGMTGLVLDLRGNPGGVGAMVVPLARLFLRESASLGVLRTRTMTQQWNVTAGPDPFTGPVVVLVDEGTASTSEIFAQAMRELGRVTIFGAGPSQGSALPSLIERLPSGARLQFVVGDYVSPAGVGIEGEGVMPDFLVREHARDFAAGRDPVLDAAVLYLTRRPADG